MEEKRFSNRGVEKKKKPSEKDGRIKKRLKCGSNFYYAHNCPDDQKENQSAKSAPICSAFSTEKKGEEALMTIALIAVTSLLSETLNYAFLDTVCSGSVCGQLLLDLLINTLSDYLRSVVKYGQIRDTEVSDCFC